MTGWEAHALCKGLPYDFMFPTEQYAEDQNKTYCRPCPVREQCLNYALDNNIHHGIFGGTSANERRRMRRQIIRDQRQLKAATA